MSAPIVHLLISQEAYAPFFSGKNKAHIYAGTSFPDIRYFVGADREITHYTPKFLLESRDFLLGMDLHNWMDEARAAYYTFMVDESLQKKTPLLFSKDHFVEFAGKIFEEEIAFLKIGDLDAMIKAFDDICADEELFGFGDDSVRFWHQKLSTYISDFGKGNPENLKNIILKDTDTAYENVQPYLQQYRADPAYFEFASGMIEYVLKSFRIEMGRKFANYS